MTEPIKQEIINNIFENGDKLITGPILQTVLIDMIDDVNGKDQEILNKTGSWDNAVTQIPNLATKEEVTNLSESVARDIANVDVDLTGYATEQWVESQGYLKEHQDISNLATKTELNDTKNNLQGNITSLSESVARDIANVSVPEGVATEAWVQSQDYASKTYVDSAVSSSSVDLTGYATETWVQNQGYLTEHQDISGLATKTELTSVSESVQTDITNLSESVASSTVWKKGTGTDSIVQVITDGTYPPTATGRRAVATGFGSKATGQFSHAEGSWAEASGDASCAEGSNTKATGQFSHAEGNYTKASGSHSHAEGSYTDALGQSSHAEGEFTDASGKASHAEGESTIASNKYEHAQGRYNHNSSNQIFSIGTGNSDTDRRNAVSVLEVDNSGSYTSSFFVQNVGGYDGTNPTPGTNDLATVIGEVSSIWKKGTGTDSIVQAIADGTNLPTASGERAIATGYNTTASGYYSHAEGLRTEASGQASHAEGSLTSASGPYSHAEGDNTKASRQASHAEGSETKASGNWSHAEGFRAEASGMYSHAEGNYTIASNDDEHAQGRYNHNSENQIFSIGAGEMVNYHITRRNAVSILAVPNADTQINTASVFIQNIGGYDGTNPTPGTNDLATVINGMSTGGGSSETLWKKGTGTDSIVQAITEGTGLSTATGTRAIAIGTFAKATGFSSHAEGHGTEASEEYSHAEGYQTKALGNSSHAEGIHTEASYYYCHAEGNHTKASGVGSHAEGFFTVASNDYEHAQGQYNYTSSNQIFSVGAGEYANGTITNRNAVSILAVPNSETQVVTASFFVQNVGGYDGTNPTPGTNDLATVINGMSSSGGSSETLWKKGEGTDSIVQILTGDFEPYTPSASGNRAIATGIATTASGYCSYAEGQSTKTSGMYSHAEGHYTNASGDCSHAEGDDTKASGHYSHAEGFYTVASNAYEHAQGTYNHNSTNQIFSVGAGEYANGTETRRNAVSILAVPNSDTKILTSSLFVQNIGGYDGTNPLPGTNDLATVLNNTETWTFTLDDGSTVTKNIVMR